MPLARRQDQGCIGPLIFGVDLGPAGNEQPDHINGTSLRCGHQSRHVAVCLEVSLGSVGQKAFYHFRMSEARCQSHGRVPALGGRLTVRSAAKKELDSFDVPLQDGRHQLAFQVPSASWSNVRSLREQKLHDVLMAGP